MALVTKNFSDIITFTRASTGAFFNSAGVLTSAATNDPRFDYNPSTLAAQGLLIEESRTNNLTYSADFTNAIWVPSNATVTANTATSPDGTVNADSLVKSAAIGHIRQQFTSGNNTFTASCYMKAGTETNGAFGITENGTAPILVRGNINLSTGVVTNVTGTITATSVGNGWWRVSATATTTTATNVSVLLYAGTFNGSETGNILIWGAQLEAGALPTSYIPTTTTALTRAADVASVNTLSPWYNASAGTLYGEITDAAIAVGGTSRRIANINDGTESDRITIGYAGATGVAAAFVTDNTVQQAGFFSPSGAYPFPTKVALAYAVNDFQASVNGSAFAAVTSGTLPTVNRMTLGDIVTGGMQQNLNGHIRRVTYYPRRLTQAELIAITA